MRYGAELNLSRHLIAFAYNLKQRFVEAHPRRGDVSSYVIVAALMGIALLARLAMAPVNAGLQYVTFFCAPPSRACIATAPNTPQNGTPYNFFVTYQSNDVKK
jgi:hypothetical protein